MAFTSFVFVIPVQAGIQEMLPKARCLDPGLRRDDDSLALNKCH